ncbi:MAG TPA: G1 family glutamic endopeptidase [Solirubrobacteraceae bacterium]
MLRPTLTRACLVVAAIASSIALLPSAAEAQSSTRSQNWAGYALHGQAFQGVSARWRQPYATCGSKTTYSAMWVGLGGYALTSTTVEQVGTELDCVGGRPRSSGWFELAPSPAHTIHVGLRPGDLVSASVTTSRGQVTVAISDLTSNHTFQRTVSPNGQPLDLSSAEWILEAPSECILGTSACQTLPLADFNSARFTAAHAQPIGGTVGTISTAGGETTKISLGPKGPVYITNHPGEVPVGTATPSSLSSDGSSFAVTFARRYTSGGLLFGSRARGRTYLRH